MPNPTNIDENFSVRFSWDVNDFDTLVEICDYDDAVQLSLRYLRDEKLKILEAGCGSGRVVKYLFDLGFTNVYGIELNKEVVDYINSTSPELNIISGNILNMPYPENYFDVILSYGVVEHFPKGLTDPLKALKSVLKVGGIAIVTVPSLNFIRQILSYKDMLINGMKHNWVIRRIFRKPPLDHSHNNFPYFVYPNKDNFFEYRLTPRQFQDVCLESGFEIVDSVPISTVDGLYHIFGDRLVKFENWKFKISPLGRIINNIFSLIPFLHNHMHACILLKRIENQ